ncbi:UDP-N-acetylmuramoyl-L-alanyl-D-glutamate--2,6-diaminopimelate ligase [Candidatus Saccharibacteria bacterium]|nr:UDP-N-acetylmuramoyl-L-alanyl-D-glutamate--2,6-diaminopimelate ligase [Candidatus Saccharibacteria bacterium]
MNLKKKVMEIPGYNRLVKPVHLVRAVVAGCKYKFPAKGLKVIGVTGTNGKTSTCFYIWKMLNESGRKAGLMTTVGWGGVPSRSGYALKFKSQVEHMTTVDSKALNKRIEAIRKAGAEYLVLEVTSHAMEQFRTLGVPVEVAVFTNLTHEHLDYHKTMENYRKAKCKLFKKAKFGVINADDKNAKAFMKVSKNYITYGIKNGKVRARKVKLSPEGVEYACGDMKIRMQIPGEFNVYNSLAAVAVGQKLGLSDEEIEEGIWALESVEGRMTKVDEGQEFTVIVDYAHTPDALEKVFKAIGEVKGRVIAVHGGAGRRDETTRAERGEILGKNSDIVIITEDDSRDENPEKIAAQFVEGAERAGKTKGKDLAVNLDREDAIALAVKLARKGDVVLLLGKGHEKTILRKDGAHEFEDVKVAQKYLRRKVKELEMQREAAEKARKLREEVARKEAERKRREEDKYGNIVE